MRLVAFLLIVCCFAFVSCGDDATEPPVQEFSLEVEVTRPDGSPVEGLKIVLWNYSDDLNQYIQDVWPKRAATVVQFSLPVTSICTMASFDLDGNLVQTAIDEGTLAAGLHQVVLGRDVEFDAGVEVMRYQLDARDEAGVEEPFTDSKLMTIVYLDLERIEGGYTDADGRWASKDRTMVPGLYDLPPMTATNENGEKIGEFTIGRELRVKAWDEASGISINVEHLAVDGPNRIRIEWDPTKAQPADDWLSELRRSRDDAPAVSSTAAKAGVPIPDLTYELWQNFPNPHN